MTFAMRRHRPSREPPARCLAAAAASILAVGALAACGSSSSAAKVTTAQQAAPAKPAGGAPQPAAVRLSGAPSVKFVLPDDRGTRSTFTVLVKVTGVRLADPLRSRSGAQLRFLLDEGKYDNPAHSGASRRLASFEHSSGRFSPAFAPRMTYRKIPPGRHILRVRLVANGSGKVLSSDGTGFTSR